MARRRARGEGGITERKDGRFQGTYYVETSEGRKRRYVYGKSQQDVADKLHDARVRYGGGQLYDAELMTVEEYLGHWLEAVKATVKEKTWISYEGAVRLHILPRIGWVKLAKLNPLHVQGMYSAELADGISKSVVNNSHRVLRAALNRAIKLDLLIRNVCDRVDPPRPDRREMRTLTAEEARRLLDAARGDRYEALFVLALCTGMRFGELLGLLWEDLNLERQGLQLRRQLVRSKNGGYYLGDLKDRDARRIGMPPGAVTALEKHRERQQEERRLRGRQWKDNGLVFCTEIGTPLDQRNVYRRHYKPLLKRADLPDIRFHDLRHSYATMTIGEGVSVRTVQRNLGHYTASYTLDRYAHVLREHEDIAALAVQNMLWERKP